MFIGQHISLHAWHLHDDKLLYMVIYMCVVAQILNFKYV